MKILSQKLLFNDKIESEVLSSYPNVLLANLTEAGLQPSKETILLAENLYIDQLISQFIKAEASHVIQYNPNYFAEDLRIVSSIIENPMLYFSLQAKSLLENITDELQVEFVDANDKPRLIETCSRFVRRVGNSNVVESADAIIEELYMNAVFDAPRLAKENLSTLPLEGLNRNAKISIAINKRRLAIACTDVYGMLDQQKFLNRIDMICKMGAGEAMNMNRATGAGIGCSLMFEHCSSLFLGVIPGKLTVVACLIPLGLSNRERGRINRNLHLVNL